MAIETKGHAQGLIMVNFIHLVDGPVTLDTTDAAVYVNGMIEINVVRDAVDLNPGDGHSISRAITHQRKPCVVSQHLVVTIHARRTRGNVRIPRFFHGVMTIPAVDPELSCVGCVGKADRLDGLVTHTRIFRCEIIP